MAGNPYPNPGGGGGASPEEERGHGAGGVENGYFSDEDDFRERGQEDEDGYELVGEYGQQQRDYYAILNLPRDVCMQASILTQAQTGVLSRQAQARWAHPSRGIYLLPN